MCHMDYSVKNGITLKSGRILRVFGYTFIWMQNVEKQFFEEDKCWKFNELPVQLQTMCMLQIQYMRGEKS